MLTNELDKCIDVCEQRTYYDVTDALLDCIKALRDRVEALEHQLEDMRRREEERLYGD